MPETLISSQGPKSMRFIKKNSTHAERILADRLRKARIKFKTKWLINGREVDFLISRYAIDVDGHIQDGDKNVMLVKAGYVPIHISNNSVKTINIQHYV